MFSARATVDGLYRVRPLAPREKCDDEYDGESRVEPAHPSFAPLKVPGEVIVVIMYKNQVRVVIRNSCSLWPCSRSSYLGGA